jgi:outer membrane immunogenic protein
MKIILVSSVAGALLATSVSAGSPEPAPVDPAPMVAPAAMDWTGPYGGVTLSAGTGSFGNDSNFPGDGSGSLSGGAAGLLLGYNWQRGNTVFGGELAFSGSNIKGDEDCVNPAFECGAEVENIASLRARLGFLATPRTMIFGSAGVASANVYGYTDGAIGENGESNRMNGYVLGAGIEYAYNERLSLRGAVLYHDLGDSDFDTDTTYSDVEVDFTTLEIGVVFRF